MRAGFTVVLFLVVSLVATSTASAQSDPELYDIGDIAVGSESNLPGTGSTALSADGLTLAAGGSGNVRVFRSTASGWTQVGDAIEPAAPQFTFGTSISLSDNGSVIAINNPTQQVGETYPGRVQVFHEVNGQWIQLGENIDGVGASNRAKGVVSLAGDGLTVAVGSRPDDGTVDGRVVVHRFDGADWNQLGSLISPGEPTLLFGFSGLAMSDDGSTLAAGALTPGGTHIYELVNDDWVAGDVVATESEMTSLVTAVAISGDGSRLAIGNDAGPGLVRVFSKTAEGWLQVGAEIVGDRRGAYFGWSVDLSDDGSILVVGAPGDSLARVFRLVDGAWEQIGDDIVASEGDEMGESVSVSDDGSVVAVGAPGHRDTRGVVRTFSLTGRLAFCAGTRATIVGTPGDDELTGTSGPDVIAALQGNDTIRGMDGDDVICAGRGDDTIYGGLGFDIMYGAQGNDEIFFANGDTEELRVDVVGGRVFAGQGDDMIYGSTRWDRVQGGPGNDELFGFEGRDWLRGGPGSDTVDGGGNIDNVHGGNDNDHLIIRGNDEVRGGAGAKDRCTIIGMSRPSPLFSCESLDF